VLLLGDQITEEEPRRVTLTGFRRRFPGALGETFSATVTLSLPVERTGAWRPELMVIAPVIFPLFFALPLPAEAVPGSENSSAAAAAKVKSRWNRLISLPVPSQVSRAG